MIKKILLGIVAILLLAIVGIFAAASMQSDDMVVERSAEIAAPAEAIFAKVNDFRSWSEWSPWEKMDPNMQRTVSEISSGEGATYAWVGNSDVGEGKMTIIESHAPSHVGIKLDFIKPMESTSKTDFMLKSSGDKTTVTWRMTGKKNLITKVMCLFVDIDKMIGADFERGLAQLRSLTETKS